ncbi:MAG: aminopeptidase P family protein [Candidatus Aminicenantales bacterium]|jgi:Xaa-Pro aminopeptidase
MFKETTYIQRRKLLKKQVPSGLLLFFGNEESPMNYAANTYDFRQDSTFLYFFGLDSPGLAAIVDIDDNKDWLFGDDIGLEDIIWMGELPKLKDRASQVGVRHSAPKKAFDEYVARAVAAGRKVHYLPPYRSDTALAISALLGIPLGDVKAKACRDFIKAVVDQRLIKSKEEVREIESALDVSAEMYRAAMKLAKPGRFEWEVVGAMEGIVNALGCRMAFPPIVTINGQTLHMHSHANELRKGRMLVMDAGAESWLHYASDITRTVPVGGKFSRRQKDIYEIVLEGQETAIRSIKPGVMYKEVHLKAARVMASGLKDLGLMKGNTDDAVARGAHAMFFPHGLGHNLGLDVHDMEDLGEDHVGYDKTVQRSGQFGLAYLRMARELRPGHVLTVEPGLYFIPALMALWKKEKKHKDFIVYDKAEAFLDFGGVRIEDNVLVTEKGRRVLGTPIPKTVAEVEKACR